MTPDAAAQLDVPRGNVIAGDPRSRGDARVGEAAHPRLDYRRDGRSARNLVRWAPTLFALPFAAWSLANTGVEWGADSVSYWLPDPIGRYTLAARALEGSGAFRYAPPLALPVLALSQLTWFAFSAIWLVLFLATLLWLTGPRWFVPALAIPVVAKAAVFGNIDLAMAASLAVPILWVVPILAKLTPVVLLAWFVARREWRSLVAIGATFVALAILAEIALPGSWVAWAATLRTEAGQADPTLVPRVALAAVVTFLAGRTDRRWLLPVALLACLPHLGWSSLVVLLAIPRLAKPQVVDRHLVERRADVHVDPDRADREAGVVGRQPLGEQQAVP